MNWRPYAFGALAAALGAAVAVLVLAWLDAPEPPTSVPVEQSPPAAPEEIPGNGASVEQAASKIQSYTNRIAAAAAAMDPETGRRCLPPSGCSPDCPRWLPLMKPLSTN